MLRNIYSTLLGMVLLLAGCQKKAEDVFEKSPDERLAEALAGYQQALVGAPNGWRVTVYPQGLNAQGIEVGGFSYYMKFNNANRVTMVSDFDSTAATTPKESGFRLKATQRPSLVFDTYSYLHLPADPTSVLSLSPADGEGFGWGSDFDFSFDGSATGDTIRLRGNFNESQAIMVRATAQEAAAYNNKQLAASMKLRGNLNIIGYFKLLTVGGRQYHVNLNETFRTITFSWLGTGGTVQSYTTGYYTTLDGIGLEQPFGEGTQAISAISFVTWNAATNTMSVSSGGTTGTITDAGQPLKVDTEAPRRWWQTAVDLDVYWWTRTGFTVNGVVDAFGIRSIPNFYYLIYWPRFGTSGTITYDLLGFVTVENNALSLPYGAAYRQPTFTADGRIVFRYLGQLGDVPPSQEAIFVNTVSRMLDASGFYLIETGPRKFDMVSRNGKAWITWER